jgi:3-hydroxyacyl-[acyl-carrier-protein] dehydratase
MRHYWVDRIEVTEPGVSATGRKAVGLSEDFFADHFPGNPVFPGIYIVEGMAQTAGALIGHASDWKQFALMVSVDRARFSSFARPGDVLEYSVLVEERTAELATVRGTAMVSDRKIAQARITFQVLDIGDMIPPIYVDQWTHALSLMFDPDGADPEEVSNR